MFGLFISSVDFVVYFRCKYSDFSWNGKINSIYFLFNGTQRQKKKSLARLTTG